MRDRTVVLNKWLTDYISSNYANEVNEMDILGVTGTNGKTTTSNIIAK